MKKIAVISVITLAVAVSGFLVWRNFFSCGNHSCNYNLKMSLVCEHACAAKNADSKKIVSQANAKTGDYTKCPVSGVIFLVKEDNSKVSYGSKAAFTCCETCAQIFNNSPEEYAANIN